MVTIVFRVLIIYVVVLFLYRLMGKRQLGQMQPFELVLTLIFADLATIPMAEVTVPVLHGIVPLLTLTIIHFLLTLFSKLSGKFTAFLSGKPVIVINPDGIDYKALKNLNMSIDDIFEAIRGCGYFKIEQIEYAIMETNGKMSVLPKSEFAEVTPNDISIKVDKAALPINLINEGKIIERNLDIAKIKKCDVEKILKKIDVKNIKDVLILTLDKFGNVYLQEFNKNYKTFTIKEYGS